MAGVPLKSLSSDSNRFWARISYRGAAGNTNMPLHRLTT